VGGVCETSGRLGKPRQEHTTEQISAWQGRLSIVLNSSLAYFLTIVSKF